MMISGFTMVRNDTMLYFPLKKTIEGILPVVDVCIAALGKSDEDDTTEQKISSIKSPKIKIIHRKWDSVFYKDWKIFAHENWEKTCSFDQILSEK